jgi:tripartite-type tricarboxylate transporter receptor subunit TctC
MPLNYRRRTLLAGALALGTLPAWAAYPDKPIKLLTPFPPGGQVATVAQALAQKMGALLGQPVVMEAVPGAGGTIAAAQATRAPKDGYTLLFATSSMLGSAKYTYRDLPYDPVADFAPVGYIGNVTIGLFASQKSGIDSLQAAIATARAKPGSLNFGSPGVGSSSHLAAELFKAKAGLSLVHVPYASNTPQMMNLVAGETQLSFSGMASGMPFTQDGRVKLIAVATRARVAGAPGVPALGEVLPGYDAPAWLGIVSPAGVPADALARLSGAMQQAMADPEVRRLLDAQGVDTEAMNARAFGDKIRREMPLWEEAVKLAGLAGSASR